MISFFKLTVYTPLYNALIGILNIIPGADIGLAIIILTIAVKIILYPLAKKSTLTQLKMKKHEAELTAIKEKHKDQKEQAVAVMEFYRKYNVNPFSGFLTILIQIPIIYSLYYIFALSNLPTIDGALLYPFIHAPELVSVEFLGLLDLSKKSIILAILAGVTSFLQMRISSSSMPTSSGKPGSFNDSLSKAMNLQMKYFLPVIVFLISFRISGAIALYWAVGNVVSIAQDFYIRRRFNP